MLKTLTLNADDSNHVDINNEMSQCLSDVYSFESIRDDSIRPVMVIDLHMFDP